MKTKKLKLIYISILLGIITFSAQAEFPFICGVENRTEILDNAAGYEYSGLAYHKDREIFFIPLDDPKNGFHVRGYDDDTKKEFNVNIEGNFSSFDFEGLTWLEQDYFVMVEEKENKIYFLEYLHSNDLNNRKFIIKSSHSTGIDTFDGNGLEGISYNPHIKTLYTVREMDHRLYSIPIDLPDKNAVGANGVIHQNLILNVQLPVNMFEGSCASGLFHLGLNFPSDHSYSQNILVISHELQKIFEFEVWINNNNSLVYEIANEFSLNNEPQAEGIVVVDKKLFVASEKMEGGLSSYVILSEFDRCNGADGNSTNYFYVYECYCENLGCTDSEACNYDSDATYDDNSCTYYFDCNYVCGGSAVSGAPCSDGLAYTINDTYNQRCECIGELICYPDIVVQSNVYNSYDFPYIDYDLLPRETYFSSKSISTESFFGDEPVDVFVGLGETLNLKSEHIILNEGFKVDGCLNATIEPCE